MLLGLPYGFNDTHFGPITETTVYTSASLDHQFILRCVICAGKVIDRNIVPGALSFAKALELDEEMDHIAARMPIDWWKIPDDNLDVSTDLEQGILRERLLQQFYFFHIKMYIHLPFLAKPTTAPSASEVSRLACMESARQMLARFRLLHAEVVHGRRLFECKTSEFIGFMAATILLIGLSTSTIANANLLQRQADLHLIGVVEGVFEKEKQQCKLAAQCWKTLRTLLETIHNPRPTNQTSANKIQEINIPYFGVVVRKSHKHPPASLVSANLDNNSGSINSSHSLVRETNATSAASTTLEYNLRADNQMVDFWGYELPDPIPKAPSDLEPTGSSLTSIPSQWLDPTFFDIDQEWGLWLDNDH